MTAKFKVNGKLKKQCILLFIFIYTKYFFNKYNTIQYNTNFLIKYKIQNIFIYTKYNIQNIQNFYHKMCDVEPTI